MTVKEVVEVKKEASDRVTVTKDSDEKGYKSDEGCFQVAPIFYGGEAPLSQKKSPVLHMEGVEAPSRRLSHMWVAVQAADVSESKNKEK